MLENTKDAFFELPAERRALHVGLPVLLALFLLVTCLVSLNNVHLLLWGMALGFSILAIFFANACEVTFNDNYETELDNIIETEVRRYEGRQNVRQNLWKNRASREELKGLVPDEILDSSLIPSVRFWRRVGNWGMFLFFLLPCLTIFGLNYFGRAI